MRGEVYAFLFVALIMGFLCTAGCGTTGGIPLIQPQIVKVAVPVPCPALKKLGPEPTYPDTPQALKAAPNIFERLKLLLAGRLLRIERDAEKSAVLAACDTGG